MLNAMWWATSREGEIANLRKRWALLLTLGIALIIAGIVALSAATAATVTLVTLLGVLLLVGAAVEFVRLFTLYRAGSTILHVLATVLYAITGLLLITRPLLGAVAITVVISSLLLVTGVFRSIFAISNRPHGWGWVLLTGFVDILLGAYLWATWPVASLWLLGVFVGVDLIVYGFSACMLAFMVRSSYKLALREEDIGRIAA